MPKRTILLKVNCSDFIFVDIWLACIAVVIHQITGVRVTIVAAFVEQMQSVKRTPVQACYLYGESPYQSKPELCS